MDQSANAHIRCSGSCAGPGSSLLLLECGSCLYHQACLPALCRCEKRVPVDGHREFENVGCFIHNCKRAREAGLSLFCKAHGNELLTTLLGRLKILGKMTRADIQAFLQAHRDLKRCQGDLLQVAEAHVFDQLRNAWQAHVNIEASEVKYITVHAATLVTEKIDNVKQFVAGHGLNPLVSAAINDDARAQRHGWRLLKNGRLGLSSFKQTFGDKDELFGYLKNKSRLTHDVDSILALYPMAATDICDLAKAGKICFVQNSTLLYVCPQIEYDAAAAAYWKAAVFDGSFKTIQNPGHGAV